MKEGGHVVTYTRGNRNCMHNFSRGRWRGETTGKAWTISASHRYVFWQENIVKMTTEFMWLVVELRGGLL
jgi:hypothetical protein